MTNTKVTPKQESFKNNKKTHVFLLFLLMSFMFWILIKLSKNYISEVKFDLVYTDMPKNKLLQNDPTKTINLTIKTIGYKLLKYSMYNKTLNYSLSEIKRKRGTNYYSISKDNINNLQAQLSAETVVLKINPDTLYFNLGVKKSKKVKVNANIDIQYKKGYNLIKNYILNPKFVTISGPSNVIDSISEVETSAENWLDVFQSFDKKIKIKPIGKSISIDPAQIQIKGTVEKITQGSYKLPIKVINLPKNYIISTFPKEVKVIYQVALKDYNKITKNSFKINCDYRKTEKNHLNYLIPEIEEKPEILFDVKIVPNKIEFLIKK